MICKQYTCQTCGCVFKATQPAKFCTKACAQRFRNKIRVKKQCAYCKSQFQCSKTAKGRVRFCSQACASAALQDVRKNPQTSPYRDIVHVKNVGTYKRICVYCGEPFQTSSALGVNRQCPKCQQKYKKLKNSAKEQLKLSAQDVRRIAQVNNIQLPTTRSRQLVSLAQTYIKPNITRQQNNAHRRHLYALKKQLGILKTYNGSKNSKLRQQLLETRKACTICGYSQFQDALDIHHIDMDRRNNQNQNLVVLCCNCHSVIHRRIRKRYGSKNLSKQSVIQQYLKLKAEVKERNKAGRGETLIRTEG